MSQTYLPLLKPLHKRLTGPTLVVLGAPGTVVDLVAALDRTDTTCYQMDRFQADRLQEMLAERNLSARVLTAPDLWDLEPEFHSAIFPSPARGERELKLDIVEQVFHVLKARGVFGVLSPVDKDQFYPPVLKKVFGKLALEVQKAGTTLWCSRDGDRKRRRHEITFTAKLRERQYIPFVSRPGVFAYGRLDDGAKSMLDLLEVQQNERIIEFGCGCGAVGIIAAMRSGPKAHLTMADSNLRAVAVAELNARSHGLQDFQTVVTTDFGGIPEGSFDLALANPPYFARHAVTRLFVERAHALIHRGGRLYLVTRQVDIVEPILEEFFPPPMIMGRRDYAIMVATRKA